MKKAVYSFVFSFVCLFFCGGMLFSANVSVRELLGTHITLLLKQNYVSSSLASSQFVDVLSFQKALDQHLSSNIVSSLDIATSESSRRLVVQNYLSNSDYLLSQLSKFLLEEERLIDQYSQEIKRCEDGIVQYNIDFSSAVSNYEYTKAHDMSQKIAEARACIARNTVYVKEHASYKNLLSLRNSTLQKKVTYLETNKEKIITYYELLRPQLLKELYDISQTLEVNFSG